MTVEERRKALKRANAIRDEQKRIKRGLREGTISLSEALEAEAAQNMSLWKVLKELRRIGPERVQEVMNRAHLSYPFMNVHAGRTVGSLTEREKAAILSSMLMQRRG